LSLFDLGVAGSVRHVTKASGEEAVGDRTLRLTNGGVVMMKLFRRKSKKGEPGTEPTVPVSAAPPVDGPEESPTAEFAQPVSANGGPVQPTLSWPDPLPVMFAPPWPMEEMIRVEEYSQDGTLVVRAELPGIDPDKDVHLSVVNGLLAIEAERNEQGEVDRDGFMLRELRYGKFSRTVPLAAGVTAASITATYKDGLLEVRIPTAAATPAPPPARIPITTS
jgi:HSP20 family protein